MNKKHAKSPCCRAGTIRYGSRRRQCVQCRKTWTIRPKRRGRKRRRALSEPVIKYLNHERIPLTREKNTLTPAARSARLRNERDAFMKRCEWCPIPEGKLIAIADAIVRYTKEGWHTWFFVFVRAIDSNDAVILPPQCFSGTETASRWRQAFAAIPESTLNCIEALVCDGHRGLMSEALWRHWHVQRCHFHLIARIQSRRSKWKSSRHFEEGKKIYRLVKYILTEQNETSLQPSLNELEEMSWTSSSPEIRKVLSGFVRNHEEYRTYLRYPHLKLPTTNNTAESLNALIQSFCNRTRGFRTVASFHAWIIALCKARGTIKCRKGNQQN